MRSKESRLSLFCGRARREQDSGNNVNLSTKGQRRPLICAGILAAFFLTVVACERTGSLQIGGDDRPTFEMSGGGTLGYLRVRGPQKQREGGAETAVIYWEIEPEAGYSNGKYISELRQITYGRVPAGYLQKYPEHGEAPRLVEGESYSVRLGLLSADDINKRFMIQDGRVVELSGQ